MEVVGVAVCLVTGVSFLQGAFLCFSEEEDSEQ
jgi:hypothetical protein